MHGVHVRRDMQWLALVQRGAVQGNHWHTAWRGIGCSLTRFGMLAQGYQLYGAAAAMKDRAGSSGRGRLARQIEKGLGEPKKAHLGGQVQQVEGAHEAVC